ncbi:hypothetical protein [Polaribacter sp. Hel1_85]|uniref:hypothetical protein n=1 Tax=Polaribacter sp. Hel1_85 TaxID=1250005 RepID=UPI00052BF858|nr:hypothetical protein [Polaribacter sp. Hel1_85]KGL63267.1 hypothetical protein PHEL85_0301 [Polaribacter sp. Hel1_85]
MTELEASELMTIIQDQFIYNFRNVKGLNYLAVKNEIDNNFVFELGYKESEINKIELLKIKTFIYTELQNQIRILDLPSIRKELYKQEIKTLKINEEPSQSSFRYSCENVKDVRQRQSLRIYNNKDGFKLGTLGGILTINAKKNYFLITNHHVIAGKCSKLNDDILNAADEKIGNLYWSEFGGNYKYGGEYDIALARITNKKYNPKNLGFHYKKPIKTTFEINEVLTIGGKSGKKCGFLYSSKAIVKIDGNDWYKNQILLENLELTDGDSGSVITDKNKSVLGLYMGKNNKLKIANNLYNLFDNKIITTTQGKFKLELFH